MASTDPAGADAAQAGDPLQDWSKSYRSGALVLENPELRAQMSVSGFVYRDVKAELQSMADRFQCRQRQIDEDRFEVRGCLISKDVADLRQNVYGRQSSVNQDGDKVFTQVYAVAMETDVPALDRAARALLEIDPVANPLDEWLVSISDSEDPTTVFYENRKLGGTITVNTGRYYDEDSQKYLDNLGKLLLCQKAERVQDGVNFSKCKTYRYYEIRDVKRPYYVMTSISVDLENNQQAMAKMRELGKMAVEYNLQKMKENGEK